MTGWTSQPRLKQIRVFRPTGKQGSRTMRLIERPTLPIPGVDRFVRDFGPVYAASGFVGFIFAATGPLAIILSVGTGAGLTQEQLASWVFGVFFVNGAITLVMSWIYSQPLCFFWTIPGTVLVGSSLQHLSFPEVIGAFYATGPAYAVPRMFGFDQANDAVGTHAHCHGYGGGSFLALRPRPYPRAA